MDWYIHELRLSKCKTYKSLQVDIGNSMIRLFYYRSIFFVYVFDEGEITDLDIFETKNEALRFAEKAYSERIAPLTNVEECV